MVQKSLFVLRYQYGENKYILWARNAEFFNLLNQMARKIIARL